MSTSMLLLVSILTAFEILYIIHSWDKHWLQTALGYKIWLDLFFSLGTTVYFALSGTISGVIIAAFSGFIFSMSLLVAAKVLGYRKRIEVNGEKIWVQYEPKWILKDLLIKGQSKLKDFFNNIKTKEAT